MFDIREELAGKLSPDEERILATEQFKRVVADTTAAWEEAFPTDLTNVIRLVKEAREELAKSNDAAEWASLTEPQREWARMADERCPGCGRLGFRFLCPSCERG